MVERMLGSWLPMMVCRPLTARAYIASALLRLKPAASCTPQRLAAASRTCCSSFVTNRLGARFNNAINWRQLVGGELGGVLAPWPAFTHSSTAEPVIAAT